MADEETVPNSKDLAAAFKDELSEFFETGRNVFKDSAKDMASGVQSAVKDGVTEALEAVGVQGQQATAGGANPTPTNAPGENPSVIPQPETTDTGGIDDRSQ